MDEKEYQKNQEKRAARKLQKETGMKYTEALRKIRTIRESEISRRKHGA